MQLKQDYRSQPQLAISQHNQNNPVCQDLLRPQVTEEGPPDGRASDILAPAAVHVFRIAKARPSIDRNEKLRLSSCLIPIPANAASSCWTLVRRRCVAASALELGLRKAGMANGRSTSSCDARGRKVGEVRRSKLRSLRKRGSPHGNRVQG